MIDFHSHILPHFDDGPDSMETSLEMLRLSAEQGVTDIVSTSHCYPRHNLSISHFLNRREETMRSLNRAIKDSNLNTPKIHLGSEVNLITDISRFKDISQLCIENTDYILIEMPYEPWNERIIDYVYKIKVLGLKPIMAHIDRFVEQDTEMLDALFELDLIYQFNADFFLKASFSKLARKFLTEGHAHVLGSDMHNTTVRPPTMGTAKHKIIKKFGQECIDFFNQNALSLLDNQPLKNHFFVPPEKTTFWNKIFNK